MPTSKSTTARANGAKSHGPVTSAGKAKSARNSLRHGLSAKGIVLPGESREDYQALLAAYVERFQPADQVEMDLVETIAVARWRLRRIANIETHTLVNKMADSDTPFSTYRKLKDEDQRLALVFKDSNRPLSLLTRYEGSLNRTFDRALKQLQLLQKTRPSEAPAKLQNEPKPARDGAVPPAKKSPEAEPSAGGHRNLTSTLCPTSVSPSDPCSPNPRGH